MPVYKDLTTCPKCTKALAYRWPNNNPENGPRVKYCATCGDEFEPCSFCPEVFHMDKRATPNQPYEHNSFGNGVPSCDLEDVVFERTMTGKGECIDCRDMHDKSSISCDDMARLRRAEVSAGWSKNP